jgi:uncharacterized damage-inducible protein DinB
MDSPSAIAKQIERTVTGPMWHGSALNELLDGVTFEQAAARPIPGAHNIWELVLHISAWAEIARQRLHNRALESAPPEVDWPPVPQPNAKAWADALERLAVSHKELARDTAALSADALAVRVPVADPGYSVETLLRGVVEHGTYHGGQIALLRRAIRA